MDTVIAFFSNPTVRRLVVGAIGAAVVALNKRLGLNLGVEEVTSLTALVLGYLAQSAAVDRARIIGESRVAAEVAANEVRNVDDAARVLGGGK